MEGAMPQAAKAEVPPAWATELISRMAALESRLPEVAAGSVGAKALDTGPGNSDRPGAMPQAKSLLVPVVRPSAKVAKARSFLDIVDQLYMGGDYPAQP